MKNLHFLWRENFIDYLWANETTGKHYFFHSGYFVYHKGVLSAYATDDEINTARDFTSNLIDDPAAILNIQNDFTKVKVEIDAFHAAFLKLQLDKISNVDIFDLFTQTIHLFGNFIVIYRLTEPHLVQHIENRAKNIICTTKNIAEPGTILADVLSSEDGVIKYGLKEYQNVFDTIRQVSKMRFDAKQFTDELSADISLLLSEVAKRTIYTIPQISNMALHELEDVLIRDISVDVAILNTRMERFGLKISVDENKVTIQDLSDVEIAAIDNLENKSVDIIKGNSVYPGKVKGVVKIVPALLDEQGYNTFINQLEQGSIIVAPMTSPHLTMAFTKVFGVITDEGGLMSHAALISREYKIPCIVGTKNATKILKDGDIVEVDADSGIVTKIK